VGIDLGALAAKVEKAKKPHPDPAALSLILFSKLDKDSVKKATEAIGKVKGVDKKGTKTDEKKGEIIVKFAGGEKITASALLDALKKDGVTATLTKEKEKEGKEKEKGKKEKE